MQTVKSTKLLLTALAALLFSLNGILKADTVFPEYKISNASITNLKMGIKQENDGVRKCCIYFAGKYKISELTDELVEQFTKEKDAKIRVLIALSLYQIQDGGSMEFLKNISKIDNDPRVRRMCMAVYDEYSKNKAVYNIKSSNSAY
jgi:hypothetical protein